MYPDEHFIDKPVKEAMETFQEKLNELSTAIKTRNEGKKLPYYYLSPDRIPNSVAVWVCIPEEFQRGGEGTEHFLLYLCHMLHFATDFFVKEHILYTVI